MLPKRNRLTAREVEKVLTHGRLLSSGGKNTPGLPAPNLSIKFLPASGAFRVSVVVPKTLIKLASRRNSIRRALYRVLARNHYPIKGIWAVIFVRRVPNAPIQTRFAAELTVLLKNFS